MPAALWAGSRGRFPEVRKDFCKAAGPTPVLEGKNGHVPAAMDSPTTSKPLSPGQTRPFGSRNYIQHTMRYLTQLLAGAALASVVIPASAQSWNFGGDFDPILNQPFPWEYGFSTDVNSPNMFTIMPVRGAFNDLDFWFDHSGLPSIGHNPQSFSVGGVLSPSLSPGDGMLHPGNTPALFTYAAVVRWTAPTAGLYSINATFTAIDTRGPDVQAMVLHNGSEAGSDYLVGNGASFGYLTTLNLSAGATLDFAVLNHDAPGDQDWTRLAASISAVPEPEHYAACAAAGLMAFGFWRRARNNHR